MADVTLERLSFAAGEASPPLSARTDLARYQIAVAIQENLVTLPEGALTRRPGTRFVAALKTESQVGALVPYRFDGSHAYVLVVNGGVARVIKQGGVVETAPATPFELAIPWAAADLANLRVAPWQNQLYAACRGFQTRVITYTGDAAWTIATYDTLGGPSELQNLDTTKVIQASGMVGAISLTAEVGAQRFTSGDIGAVWRLDEANFSLTPVWQANEVLTQASEPIPGVTGVFGNYVNPADAFDGNPGTFARGVAATDYVGQSFSPASPLFLATLTWANFVAPTAAASITIRGRVGVPANSVDGTVLTGGFVAPGTTGFLVSNGSSFDHFWATIDAGAGMTVGIYEIVWSRIQAGGATLRRWQNNVYEAIGSGSTGVNPPTHTSGDYQVTPTAGLIMRYRHNGRGVVKITAVADAAHASATVLDRVPDSIVAGATYRWFPPAWSGNVGWPEQVTFFQRRACFARGKGFWGSRTNAPTDHTPFDTAEGAADAAISVSLTPRVGTASVIEWMVGSGILVAGARDGEWMIRAADSSVTLTATNVDADEDGDEGSCPHIPARVGNGVIYLGRSRRKLHFVAFDRLSTALSPEEISKASRHILEGQGAWLAWQKDPHRVMWIGCLDGALVGATWMPKEQVIALHRHPLANGYVEAGCAIAESDDAQVEVYLIVRRIINGGTHRYVERLQEFFPLTLQTDPSAGWFLDCALAFTVVGPPVTSVTGLGHLEGETVGVFCDGAVQADKVVTAGAIALERPAKVGGLVGKRIAWRVKSLPQEVQTQTASSATQPKGANHVMVDMLNAAGGFVAVNGGRREALQRTGTMTPGGPVPLQTGRVRATTLGPEQDELVWEIFGDDPLPFTLRSVRLKAVVEED